MIRDADVTYADAAAARDIDLALDEVTGRLGGGQDLALHATGRLQDAPLEVSATGGSLDGASQPGSHERAGEDRGDRRRIPNHRTGDLLRGSRCARCERRDRCRADLGEHPVEHGHRQSRSAAVPGDGAGRAGRRRLADHGRSHHRGRQRPRRRQGRRPRRSRSPASRRSSRSTRRSSARSWRATTCPTPTRSRAPR